MLSLVCGMTKEKPWGPVLPFSQSYNRGDIGKPSGHENSFSDRVSLILQTSRSSIYKHQRVLRVSYAKLQKKSTRIMDWDWRLGVLRHWIDDLRYYLYIKVWMYHRFKFRNSLRVACLVENKSNGCSRLTITLCGSDKIQQRV